MKSFSRSWISSSKPRKQRKYRFNAPLHIKQKFMSAHLSKELREKYSRRSLALRKGDKVKIMRGTFSGHVGKVDDVDLKKGKIIVSGIERTKKDGSKAITRVHPSKVMVIELNLDDALRQKKLDAKKAPKPDAVKSVKK